MRTRPLAVLLALAPALVPAQSDRLDALDRRLAPLTAKYLGVTFAFAKKETEGGWADVSFKPVSAESDALARAYTDILGQEFAKYPTDFVRACRLKRVELVEKLAVGTQYRAAVPDYEHEVLYFDVTYAGSERYARHVVHHEYYHMLEQEWNGDAFFRDPNWLFLNEPGFEYGAGGSSAYGRGDVWSFNHPKPGFINLYSTYGPEEDKAEVWAVMFVPQNWALVNKTVTDDPILRAKVSYLREFARSKSPAMNDPFWKRVSGS